MLGWDIPKSQGGTLDMDKWSKSGPGMGGGRKLEHPAVPANPAHPDASDQVLMHSDFERFYPFGGDIAMRQLHLPVNFTSSIVPVCLPALYV